MKGKRSYERAKNEMIAGLRVLTELIAFTLCLILIVASGILTFEALQSILLGDTSKAVLDALFVVILLELFYVIRSFITRGSMNVGVIVNVGIIASVKELIFNLESITLQMAASFGLIFLSLGLLYVMEIIHYAKKNKIQEED